MDNPVGSPVDGVPEGVAVTVVAGDADRNETGNNIGVAAATTNGRAASPATHLGPDMCLGHHLSSRRHG
ncbi:MAG TPA: hypothetical protein VIR27_17040 [Mycobacteriales bacterium]